MNFLIQRVRYLSVSTLLMVGAGTLGFVIFAANQVSFHSLDEEGSLELKRLDLDKFVLLPHSRRLGEHFFEDGSAVAEEETFMLDEPEAGDDDEGLSFFRSFLMAPEYLKVPTSRRLLEEAQDQDVSSQVNNRDDDEGLTFFRREPALRTQHDAEEFRPFLRGKYTVAQPQGGDDDEGLSFYRRSFQALPPRRTTKVNHRKLCNGCPQGYEEDAEDFKTDEPVEEVSHHDAPSSSDPRTLMITSVLMGIASALLAFGLLLWIAELKYRLFDTEKQAVQRGRTKHGAIARNHTSTTTHESGGDKGPGRYAVRMAPGNSILPPLHPEDENLVDVAFCFPEDDGLSATSTMTGSLVDVDAVEEKKLVRTPLGTVKELTDIHRIDDGEDLSSLVYSSTTSNNTSSPVRELVRLSILQGTKSSRNDEGATISISQETAGCSRAVESGSAADGDETQGSRLTELRPQQVLSKQHSTGKEEEMESYVRDIYFVPIRNEDSVDKGLCLDFDGASCSITHPVISLVHKTSPLKDRVFAGDILLCVNDSETDGLSSDETKALFQFYANDELSQVVRLTVLSLHQDEYYEPVTTADRTLYCATAVEV